MFGKILNGLNTNSGAITTIATIILVIITGYYARIMYLTLLEMEKNRKETEKNIKIQSIEKSFEKLYYPLRDVFKRSIEQFGRISSTINKIDPKRLLGAELGGDDADEDVIKAWQTIIQNYYYFRKDFDNIIRFSYLSHSKNLERELEEFVDDHGGNEILHVAEILNENWDDLGISKIYKIQKSIPVSFLEKMMDNCNNRLPKLSIMISEDIEQLKSERTALIG
jgi:hypothetical protein